MSTYKELLAEKERIEQQLVEARKREIAEAVRKVRELVEEYGLNAADVFPAGKPARSRASSRTPVAAKYRNPATGQTWSGRGRTPTWMQGRDKQSFLIA